MKNSNKSRLLKIMSIIFNESNKKLNENISMLNYEKWDSLKNLNLLLALEEEFKIKFSSIQTTKMLDFKSVLKYINKNTKKK
tara:strand:- start:1210 stop:1455 length:246 start_codon:yes stop_codon:yes gene_type:complete